MTEKIIKEHSYLGVFIGRTIVETLPQVVGYRTVKGHRRDYQEPIIKTRRKTGFETDLSESDVRELLEKMPLYDKIHMKSQVPGLYAALGVFGAHEEDYLTDDEVGIYVLGEGFKTLTELNHGDQRAWRIVKSRGLERELFPSDAVLGDFPEIREQTKD